MTVPTGSFQTYQAVGNREDLTDMIYNISPTETPAMSNFGRTKARGTFHEWQVDSLDTATEDNITVEGDDAATDTASATTRYANYTQIMDKVPRVTRTQEVVDKAGRRREMSYQIAKRGKELKRDMEKRICSQQGAVVGTAATGREMAGIGRWLAQNQVKVGGATATTIALTAGAPATDVTDSGVADTLVETDLQSAIAACWTDGGDPNIVLCDAVNKQVISTFDGIATQYRENPQIGQATIIGAADVYVSDFGTVNIIPDRFMATSAVYVLDTEYWKVAYLDPIQQKPLAKTGHSDQRMIWTEFTLEACNPESSAKMYTTN